MKKTYIEVTCDLCNKKEKINLSLFLPFGWAKVTEKGLYNDIQYDVCNKCKKQVIKIIDELNKIGNINPITFDELLKIVNKKEDENGCN